MHAITVKIDNEFEDHHCADETPRPRQHGEERGYSAYTSLSLFTLRGRQDRNSNKAKTWRQELMQRLWSDVPYYWLAQPVSLQNPGPSAQGWQHP